MSAQVYVPQETRHTVPKCNACGWVGPWQVAPLLEPHHIIITLLFLFLWGGGLVYLLIVLIVRSNENNRSKICPNCHAKNMHTFVYADPVPGAFAVQPVVPVQPVLAVQPVAPYQQAAPPRTSHTVLAPAGAALGAAGPLAAISLNGRYLTSLPLSPGSRYIIGRGSASSVVVTDPMVSGSHAALQVYASGDLGISDLGSTNGTFVNGTPLSGEHMLLPGDEVFLGTSNCRLTVEQG